jgi:putative transposase
MLLNKVPIRIQKYLELIWADSGYTADIIDWVANTFQVVLSIVKKRSEQVGFMLLPKRWKVERSFGWLNFYRRLSKDYEDLPGNSEHFIYVSVIQINDATACTKQHLMTF